MTDDNNQEKNIFKGELGDYKIIETQDGSITLHSEAFNEACHSLSGAVMETIYNYVEGCEIAAKLDADDLVCLEVGFGLGTGYKTTVEKMSQLNLDGRLTFVSTELDAKLVEFAIEKNSVDSTLPFPDFSTLLFKKEPLPHYVSEKNGHQLFILIGDARETVAMAYQTGLFKKVSAIYQDAFSPKRNPTLWTFEWFETLRSVSNNDVMLSTYSSSNSIRKSLIKAGWSVFNRKGFGTKRTATVAQLTGESDADVLLQLGRSPIKALEDADIES